MEVSAALEFFYCLQNFLILKSSGVVDCQTCFSLPWSWLQPVSAIRWSVLRCYWLGSFVMFGRRWFRCCQSQLFISVHWLGSQWRRTFVERFQKWHLLYLVNKIEFQLILYFDFFDLENFLIGSQKLHLTPLPYYYYSLNEESSSRSTIWINNGMSEKNVNFVKVSSCESKTIHC